MLDKLLDRIKEIIRIEKFDATKIFFTVDDKLSGDIILPFFMILRPYKR